MALGATSMNRDRRNHLAGWWLIAVLGFALFAVACNSSEASQDPDSITLETPTASDQASLTPDLDDPTQDADSESGDSPPLTLALPESGENAPPSDSTSATLTGLETGFTEEGYPYRGNPDAPVTLIEYSDYACPFCDLYTAQTLPVLLEQYGLSGQVKFVFRDLPLVSLHPTAPAAHTAAACAGEQSADLYWVVHDEVFAQRDAWTGLPDPTEFLSGLAEGVGVETVAYQECVASGRFNEQIDKGAIDAQALGFNGTPSFQLVADGLDDTYTLIGAQPLETFQSYLDSLISGEAPTDPETGQDAGEASEPAGLPFWADIETGLQPDPDRPGVNLAGDHYKGNPDASVVVVEFSDYECPFCRDHAIETQPLIDETLVDTGDVLWVFKHLPRNIHPRARVAAVAAECAGDQGQFWEMHDLLFETSDEWADEDVDVDTALIGLAATLPLDMSRFESCFASRTALERVLADMTDADGIVSETPSFVIIQGERGSLMQGSIPADQFIASLRGRLEGEPDTGSSADG